MSTVLVRQSRHSPIISTGIRRLEVLFYVLILTMILAFGAEYVISAPDAAEVTAGILIPRLVWQ
jgi:Mn2+/Fe2+ NRAMP family transporter